MKILYEDADIAVLIKPAGVESQASRGFAGDMVSMLKNHLSTGRGEPYLGVIHRLDKPVSGIMVFAKNKKAAGALGKALSENGIHKSYLAVVCGQPVEKSAKLVDYMLKPDKGNISEIADKSREGAKRAELCYEVLKSVETESGIYSLLKIDLISGRHHQIRLQLSAHGFPVAGDLKYGKAREENAVYKASAGERSGLRNAEHKESAIDRCSLRNAGLALAAVSLSFKHPVSGRELSFEYKPAEGWFKFMEEMS